MGVCFRYQNDGPMMLAASERQNLKSVNSQPDCHFHVRFTSWFCLRLAGSCFTASPCRTNICCLMKFACCLLQNTWFRSTRIHKLVHIMGHVHRNTKLHQQDLCSECDLPNLLDVTSTNKNFRVSPDDYVLLLPSLIHPIIVLFAPAMEADVIRTFPSANGRTVAAAVDAHGLLSYTSSLKCWKIVRWTGYSTQT